MSVGGEYTAIFAAIDELVPCAYRGRVDLVVDGSWHLGTFMASLFYSLPVVKAGWQLYFGLGAIAILPVFFLRRMVPESPRWLV